MTPDEKKPMDTATFFLSYQEQILSAWGKTGKPKECYESLLMPDKIGYDSFRKCLGVFIALCETLPSLPTTENKDLQTKVTTLETELSKLKEELQEAREINFNLASEGQFAKAALEQVNRKIKELEQKVTKVTETGLTLLEAKEKAEELLREAWERIAEFEKVTKVTEQAEGKPEPEVTTVTDERGAIIEALKSVRGNVSNGVIPTAMIAEAFNEIVQEPMKITTTQRLSMLILSLTGNKAMFRQAKYRGKNNRCLVWNKAIENLIRR